MKFEIMINFDILQYLQLFYICQNSSDHPISWTSFLWMMSFLFLVGNQTNSMALVADSFHMLSDVIAIIIAFVSVRLVSQWLNR